jgi:hypothetical protein
LKKVPAAPTTKVSARPIKWRQGASKYKIAAATKAANSVTKRAGRINR